ncbi:adenylosuccinate lyase [Luteirhabdus pelagi]|uniref:adenylosuccinate lyase n=1 Tax=Luteirhabdus pelagi TaxID=2792783 RepID=UPI00193A6467|nr:adenylosuccinate lyase [Luteirhabdus pelagi]
MANSELLHQISYAKAYRENRLGAAKWVLANPETFGELLEYCYDDDDERAYKATWVLEFVCKEKLDLLYPHFDYFFEHLHTLTTDQSLRPMAHICEMIVLQYYKKKETSIQKCFTPSHKQKMTECCFDWLISDQKVACQVRAMTCLQYLGAEIDWVHPELKNILQQNLPTGSAGYKSRGKKILKSLSKS